MKLPLHGRCFCGAVLVEAKAEPFQVSWCHCRDCRRQTGAPAVVWAGFRSEDVHVAGAPRRRRSSEHIVRGFCPDCGTPFSYEDDRLAGEIYIHTGVFDEADQLVPDRHAYVTSKLFWLHLEDGLAKFETTTRRRPG
ncbi:GFA family protein [Propylenella binzhouense]|uniref:GFA family protein n=1 Tax=Propylenella binzhouense TaxID=2555902 RepID=UPI001371CE96